MGLKAWIAKTAIQGKLPLWMYRLIGKMIGKELNLVEDINMADGTVVVPAPGTPVETKKWYQSKAVWSALVTALLGAIQPVSAAFGHPIAVPLWIIEVLAGLGIYGIRTADKPVA